MKDYGSKDEIYRDYPIAVKFVLKIPPKEWHHVRDYEGFLDALTAEMRAKVTEFSRGVKNFRQEYPLSVGLYVEVPELDDAGQEFGVRFVLLEHETGLEFFIPIVEWVRKKVGEAVLDQLWRFMRDRWPEFCPKKFAISHVEIRTEDKGVMRIRFSDFNAGQLGCLLKKFNTIQHLSEVNQHCFNGHLVTPSHTTVIYGSEGKPSPRQADD